MKLTELFTSDKQIADSQTSQTGGVKSDAVNRQIRSLVPGQTIQGEVIGKNGNEVQIRVADDLVLQAKLEQNMNLEIGKTMTFEVKNNGKALMLSPLFTNVATDANVLKALDMASLPVNDTSVSVAKQLMAAGLSIDRTTLQQVYREVNLFPQNDVSDIVNLHKLQMPVNETNVTQMASYRNLTHQLVNGLNNVLDAVPEMFSDMMESGNTEGAVNLLKQLVLLTHEGTMSGGTGSLNTLQNGQENVTALPVGDAAKAIITETGMVQTVMSEEAADTKMVSVNPLDIPVNVESGAVVSREGIAESVVANSSTQSGDLSQLLPGIQNQPQEQTQTVAQQFTQLLHQIANGANNQDVLVQLKRLWKESGGDKELLKPVLHQLKQQWTITPQEVAGAGSLEKLYNKMDRQLRHLAQTMESLGQTNGAAYKSVVNLTQNLDFMQQMNQMYTYVQLPLRLQQGDAHGDLYVYTNKKHLAANDGQISALLHLDMEHLGPVDVYVAMKQNNVKTQFYLKDDELLDFMMEHMDILTQRLQKRGYNCEFEMQVRNQEEGNGGTIQKVLLQENHVPLAEYSFDVRT